MLRFRLMGFGSRSTRFLRTLIFREFKAQNKELDSREKCVVERCHFSGKNGPAVVIAVNSWIEQATQKDLDSFARACALLYKLVRNARIPLRVNGAFLRRTARIGPRTLPLKPKKK